MTILFWFFSPILFEPSPSQCIRWRKLSLCRPSTPERRWARWTWRSSSWSSCPTCTSAGSSLRYQPNQRKVFKCVNVNCSPLPEIHDSQAAVHSQSLWCNRSLGNLWSLSAVTIWWNWWNLQWCITLCYIWHLNACLTEIKNGVQ